MSSLRKINIVLFLIAFPFFTSAHVVGNSLEKTDAHLKVDIGYDSLDKNPPAGEAVRFDFRLANPATGEAVDYTRLFFSLRRNGETVFSATVVKPEFGPGGATVTFPQAGDYELYARYERGADILVADTFHLTVQPADNVQAQTGWFQKMKPVMYVISGVVCGIVAMAGINVFRKKKAA